jgi:putative spermidine/putrescine transport system substrate-binding protein
MTRRSNKKRFARLAAWLMIFVLPLAGCGSRKATDLDFPEASWEQITNSARGTTVRMAMWDGDPAINAFMRGFVRERMETEHGVDVEFVGGQGNSLVDQLMVELDVGKTVGDIDLMWINGETFYQLRQIDALFGPFTTLLPNNQYINWDDPFIAIDFQQPVEGYECPWGNVQLALIYHSGRVTDPPHGMEALSQWVRQHPGRFTIDNGFTGMTFLKSLLYAIAGGPGAWDGEFDEAKYLRESAKLWDYLRKIQPFLWREGETFPEGVAQLHQLMMNGEVDFSMSNNDGEVDNKVLQGVLPDKSRAYVWESGTIRNSHYLGIPINAPNKAAAMVLANFLISPEAQLQKAKPEVWGDGSVLDIQKLPEEYQTRFSNIPGRTRVEPREALAERALMEPAPEIMIRLHSDFRKYIIEGN